MARAYPQEFRDDVAAVARKHEAPLSQIARDFAIAEATAGVVFVGCEGFGLIANAATNMAKPAIELPRAIYGSVAIVIVLYVLISTGVATNVTLTSLRGLGVSALAVAPRPSLGQARFRLIAIAALLSTASAVNATLFGSTNIAYQIAKNGGLPPGFNRKLLGS